MLSKSPNQISSSNSYFSNIVTELKWIFLLYFIWFDFICNVSTMLDIALLMISLLAHAYFDLSSLYSSYLYLLFLASTWLYFFMLDSRPLVGGWYVWNLTRWQWLIGDFFFPAGGSNFNSKKWDSNYSLYELPSMNKLYENQLDFTYLDFQLHTNA